jgi:rhodanese-related sulfurtransferase
MAESIQALTPQAVAQGLSLGTIQLIDVREPNEHQAERIAGAILYPLSTFDPAKVPRVVGKTTVFHCGIGKRSEAAALKCLAAGAAVVQHLDGGLAAWKQAGLPTQVG